jgi:hypothetical protein
LVRRQGRVIVNLFDARRQACIGGSATNPSGGAAFRTGPPEIRHLQTLLKRLVRAEGLEPPQLSSLEPKSSASTSSATPASSIMSGRDAAGGGCIT